MSNEDYCFLELLFPRKKLARVTEILNEVWINEECGPNNEPYDGDIRYKKWWDELNVVGNCNIIIIYDAYQCWIKEISALRLSNLDFIVMYGQPVFRYEVIMNKLVYSGPLTGNLEVCITLPSGLNGATYDDIKKLDQENISENINNIDNILKELINNNSLNIGNLRSALLFHKMFGQFIKS